MELIKNHYYKFNLPGFKFWFKEFTPATDNNECNQFEFRSFELTGKHPLKFVGHTNMDGFIDYWFEYYDMQDGDFKTGVIGLVNSAEIQNKLSEIFEPYTFLEALPKSLINDLKEIFTAIDSKKAQDFFNTLYSYQMGAENQLVFELGVKELQETETRRYNPSEEADVIELSDECDIPEFSFDVFVQTDELKLSIYNVDASWGEPYCSALFYTNEGANKNNKDWEDNKDLLIERINRYKTQLKLEMKTR